MTSTEELIKEIPFIEYRDMNDELIKGITYLDDVPDGWKELLLSTFRKIAVELKKAGLEDKYRIIQVKEKYGSGRIYDGNGNAAIDEIIAEFEKQSEVTCCDCGKPASWHSRSWILPWCEECRASMLTSGKFVTSDFVKMRE